MTAIRTSRADYRRRFTTNYTVAEWRDHEAMIRAKWANEVRAYQRLAQHDDLSVVSQYNRERPHQARQMKVPADLYVRSARVYRALEELTYPFHDKTFTVTQCGRICFNGRNVNLSHVFAGQNVRDLPSQ